MGYIKLHKNEVCKFARYKFTCFSQQIDDLTIFFILFLQTERKKAKPSFRLPTFCWIFDQRVSTRVGQSASCFRFLLRDILGFPGYDEANSCGFDLITFCKPIGEYLLHSHRELGYGKVCLFGKELKLRYCIETPLCSANTSYLILLKDPRRSPL